MKIEPATRLDVLTVALAMRQRDFQEFTAVTPADTREHLARLMAERYGDRDDVLCVRWGEYPVVIGGALEIRPNVVTLLLFATDNFARVVLPLTRFIKRELFPRYFAAGVHRVEAVAMAGYDEVHKWLGVLGLTPETGPLLGYGKRGEAFIQFSKVVE